MGTCSTSAQLYSRALCLLSVGVLAGCEGDPANLAGGARYVWVDAGAPVVLSEGRTAEIGHAGYAYARLLPESKNKPENAMLFSDSTMSDTIALIGSAFLQANTPDGVLPRPGATGLQTAQVRGGEWRKQRLESPSLQGPVTKAGFAACLTEELFDQWVTAAVQKDQRGMAYLLGAGCVLLRQGLPVSVLDRTWTGQIRIRIYAGDEALEFYTYGEAVDSSH